MSVGAQENDCTMMVHIYSRDEPCQLITSLFAASTVPFQLISIFFSFRSEQQLLRFRSINTRVQLFSRSEVELVIFLSLPYRYQLA